VGGLTGGRSHRWAVSQVGGPTGGRSHRWAVPHVGGLTGGRSHRCARHRLFTCRGSVTLGVRAAAALQAGAAAPPLVLPGHGPLDVLVPATTKRLRPPPGVSRTPLEDHNSTIQPGRQTYIYIYIYI